MLVLSFSLLGLIIGSFLNVVILRYGTRSLGGRSACMACGGDLFWYDNIPVLSWIVLRGRCRFCRSSISLQYILVEVSTGVLFAFIGGAPLLPLPQKIVYCVLAALLIALAVYDTRHTVIPDPWVYAFALIALASSFLTTDLQVLGAGWLMLAGPLAALPLFLLWLVSGGKWMGLGDAKLALGMGWLLGPLYGPVSVIFAFILGAFISVAILLPFPYIAPYARKTGIARLSAIPARFTMKSEVPFGPFLVASCLIVWFAFLYHVPLPL